MFDSIYKDLRYQLSHGNMVMKLIIINVIVWLVVSLAHVFTPPGSGFYNGLIGYLAIPGEFSTFITRPWTVVTSMFLHQGGWHLVMNMLYLYWFGRIVGDLIGDHHIFPVYLYGGLVGSVTYLLSYAFFGGGMIGSIALGASAATMALVVVAGVIAPEYVIRLILLGAVKLKYIVLALIVLDIVSLGGSNTGGHLAHIGGMIMGFVYIYLLRNGTDLSFGGKSKPSQPTPFKVSSAAVAQSIKRKSRGGVNTEGGKDRQQAVDRILEKIKKSGYDSLSKEEKETLFIASKRKD